MGHKEIILNLLRYNPQERFSNSDIVSRTQIRPHQQVFQITQFLLLQGTIQGEKHGKDWIFWAQQKTQQLKKPITKTVLSKKLSPVDVSGEFDVRIVSQWSFCGVVRLDGANRIVFPKTEAIPGIYRFTINAQDSKRIYIGETDNLQRRMQHYRTPGKSQQTNIRLGKAIQKALETGGEVNLFVITERVFLTIGKEKQQMILNKKSERVLLEHAALCEAAANGHATLNL